MTLILLKNSLLLALLTTLFCLALGLGSALALLTLSAGWRRILLAASVTALILPPFLVTNCWMDVADLLGGAGASPTRFGLFSMAGAVWVLAWLYWPVTLLLVWASWQNLDASHLEQEEALSGLPVLRWVLWPMAQGAVVLGALITAVLVLNHFAVPALLQVKVLPAMFWIQFNTTFSYATALQTGWPLLIVPLGLILLWRGRVVPWPSLGGAASPTLLCQRLGPTWIVLSRVTLGLALLLSVALPAGHLVFNPRTWTQMMPAWQASAGPALHSLILAASTATACTAAGLLLWRWRWLRGLWIPFLLPGVMLGVVLILLLNRPWLEALYRGSAVVVLAWTLRFAAPAWQMLRHAFLRIDKDLTDAARASGASGWALLRHVHWPQVTRTAAAAWYLVYLLCLWDVETLILIAPPGGETLALRVFNLLHYGHNDQVNALCLMLVGLAMLPCLLGMGCRAAWRTARRHGHP